MSEKYSNLIARLHTLNDLQKSIAVLHWDRETNMPPQGNSGRTQQITTLNQLAHEIGTSNETGDLLAAAEAEQAVADYDSNEASLLRFVRRQYDEEKKFSSDFVRRRSEITGAAGFAWAQARAKNDFASFAPHLKAAVGIAQESAEILGYEDEKYDALLDQYERGMKTRDVRAIFETVKRETVPLIHAISAQRDAVDDSFLFQSFDVDAQKKLARYAAESIGYDFTRGHLGQVEHPFSTSFGRNDVRITTRFNPEFATSSLFATLHEAGHALYEKGVGEELDRTPLAQGTSSGIHESQSRLFENQVGRSRGYWDAHFAQLQAHFPQQMGMLDAERFYRAINKVQPSFIRVEADELTYNMHIILRFELEQALINGELSVDDLPAAWNEKMQTLLGITPPDDAHGVLQDVHWSQAAFGYFPTYTLGNLYAAMFMETARGHDAQIVAELAQGNTVSLLAWLRNNIHRHGSKYDAPELCRRATGHELSADPFVRYVREKFGGIYQFC